MYHFFKFKFIKLKFNIKLEFMKIELKKNRNGIP